MLKVENSEQNPEKNPNLSIWNTSVFLSFFSYPPTSASTVIVHTTQEVAAWNDRSAANLLEPVFQPAFPRWKKPRTFPVLTMLFRGKPGWLQLWPTDQKLFWLRKLIAFFSAAVEITQPCVHHARVEDNYESFKILNFLDKHSVRLNKAGQDGLWWD